MSLSWASTDFFSRRGQNFGGGGGAKNSKLFAEQLGISPSLGKQASNKFKECIKNLKKILIKHYSNIQIAIKVTLK